MNEIALAGMLLLLGVISILFYIIFNALYKNQKFYKINEKEIELIRAEKELDRAEALQRGLRIIRTEKRQAVK
ncbi:MAG: hypothetical protein NTX65_03840 [Ignavibacteriales bacterium]|nr:hypothetical protein [Ignavibacteriales bacterium]